MYAVMLAKKFNPDKTNPTGWLMSEKLDGVRAYWDGQRIWSRNGKIYNAPDWFTEDLPRDFHLDGELWLDRGKFNTASGIVRKKEPTDEWADLEYIIFDAPQAEGGFEERIVAAQEALSSRVSNHYARVLDQEVCEGMEHLQERMKEILKVKGEGVMLRASGSPYIRSRSSHLLKVKKFKDSEAMVYDIQEGTGKYEGMMGALLVYWNPPRMKEIVTFKIGTGFTDADRELMKDFWVGKIVKFSYQEESEFHVPRFPAYLGLRE